ncbi:FAD-binding oxidoreductase [Falsihalocynthiibacter arcticus]|uniref:FAD-linked oxidase n=1 Tax=Falsihalocynthiibacter arcticus TaxID=1579316 RepID=A0A126V1A7_9RHOB|nr:FAD-binding oxidoreductase [Falsihalocynthiibacter arcticus]AML51947.1 FAD-linked oxidase [Falsihalocynthiibacter arcticus]
MSDIANRLRTELGVDVVPLDVPERNHHDWSGLPPVSPLALVRACSTEQVAIALRLCHETETPVVPQGGLTGISGGAHPVAGAVVLSLERMNRVLAFDAQMATLTVEAGCVLQTAQEAAQDGGLMLAVDLGARGSCTIGGVIATNAGGNQVLRYGMAREHVLGLEVVLADGTVLNSMNNMIKNNAGLDLKQLFIGTEGLMGIITKAVMRLQPRPSHSATAFCGCTDTAAAVAFLKRARADLGPALISFEVMWPSFYDLMRAGINAKHPLSEPHGVYVVIEAGGFDDNLRGQFENCLGVALEEGALNDAVIAASVREERELWAVREAVAEYGHILGPLTAFDVGLPLESIAEAVSRLEAEIAERWPGARALSYGHMGDSNLHLVVNVPQAGTDQPASALKTLVYGIVRDLGGTISAEHGIGAVKRDYLGYSRTEAEIDTMRRLKFTLDPRGILNPGKGFAP